MKRKIFPHIVLIVTACLLVLVASQMTSITITQKEDQKSVVCGWPFPFFTEDQSAKDPPYPWETHCGIPVGSGFSNTFIRSYSWLNLFLNVFFFYVLAALTYFGICYMIRQAKSKKILTDHLAPVQHLLNNKDINANCIIAKLDSRNRSQFFQSLRHFSSHPKDLSTTHLFLFFIFCFPN